jgi:hypothetical protein
VSVAFALLLSQLAIGVFAQSAFDASRLEVYEHSRRLAQDVHKHLRDDQLKDAMEVLGKATDLDAPIGQGIDNGLASAAGGVYRHLAALDSDQRYELLHDWSMPTDSRRTVQVLTSIVPTAALVILDAHSSGPASSTSFRIFSACSSKLFKETTVS